MHLRVIPCHHFCHNSKSLHSSMHGCFIFSHSLIPSMVCFPQNFLVVSEILVCLSFKTLYFSLFFHRLLPNLSTRARWSLQAKSPALPSEQRPCPRATPELPAPPGRPERLALSRPSWSPLLALTSIPQRPRFPRKKGTHTCSCNLLLLGVCFSSGFGMF